MLRLEDLCVGLYFVYWFLGFMAYLRNICVLRLCNFEHMGQAKSISENASDGSNVRNVRFIQYKK